MERDPDQVLQYLTELEETAEEILTDQQQIIDFDRRRQKTREAIRSVQKDSTTRKSWVCLGNMFIRFPQREVKHMLEKDFDSLTNEMNNMRKGLKPKVEKLRDMEHKEALKGFDLSPLSREEMNSITELL